MINLFSSDPERARAEKCAHLEFEIKRMEEREEQMKSKLADMEKEIEKNLAVSMINFHQLWPEYNCIQSIQKYGLFYASRALR